VKSPNLDLKQGIYYLVREGEGGRERQREREKVRHKERERERADNKNHGQRCVAQLVINKYIYDLNVFKHISDFVYVLYFTSWTEAHSVPELLRPTIFKTHNF
jgi:hypothetical protein